MRGLYALTPDEADDRRLMAQVAAATRGGLRYLQYRNKQADPAVRQRQAALLADYCRARNITLIINDDVALARSCGAAGVHLGAADTAIAAARDQLGAGAIIGSTCKDSIAAAARAAAAGASYIALGAVFASASKPQATRCPLAILTQAKTEIALPLVAIGGITAANATEVINAGADAIALIRGIFSSGDITAATRQLLHLFPDNQHDSR